MKEKLVIKNFGPIKDVELELGRFTVLIGENATGKSTVAKLLSVCRYFSFIIGDESNGIFENPFTIGLYRWGIGDYLKLDEKEGSFIHYTCKHYTLTVQYSHELESNYYQEDDKIDQYYTPRFSIKLIPLSVEFKNLLSELEKIKPESYKGGYGFVDEASWIIPSSFFLNDVRNVMDNPFYMPTERGLQSVFSLGQTSIPNLDDSLYSYFSKVDGILRNFKGGVDISPLGIVYEDRNGQRFIKKKEENRFYLLKNSASGYQSTVPIILIFKHYELQKRAKTFIIEEPELNLFPVVQNKLMQHLVDKTMNYGNNTLITTHSPYVLTSLNNMMYAHQIGQTDPEKISKIIEKQYWINPDDVSAYIMKPDGTAENIVDDEIKQIKAEKIDEISREFNKKYDEMLDIKFSKKNEG